MKIPNEVRAFRGATGIVIQASYRTRTGRLRGRGVRVGLEDGERLQERHIEAAYKEATDVVGRLTRGGIPKTDDS